MTIGVAWGGAMGRGCKEDRAGAAEENSLNAGQDGKANSSPAEKTECG